MNNSLSLEDVCELIVDCKNRTPPPSESGNSFGWAVGTPNITGGVINIESCRRVSRQTFAIWTARAVPQEDDLIITREAPVGRVGRVPAGVNICLGQRTMLLRPDRTVVDPRFLHYLLMGPRFQHSMHSFGAGTTVPHLKVGEVRRLPLPPLPTLSVQRAIGEILGALDDKIAVNERIAATYELLLRLRFEELMIDVEPTSGREVVLSELVELSPRASTPLEDEAVYLDMASIPIDTARVQEWSRRAPKSGTRFQNGDTVMARITPCLENGKTAFIDFMMKDEVGVGSTEFIVLRAKKGIPIHTSYFLARSPRFRGYAIQNMVGSSGRQRVSAAALEGFTLTRPGAEEMAAFGESAAAAFAHMKSLDAESRLLRELRDALLPKLLSGETRVRDAEKAVEDAT